MIFLFFVLATVYTSPMKALNSLKHHDAKDVDFVLVALHMKEMHGFQFLHISREMHKNLQVISKSELYLNIIDYLIYYVNNFHTPGYISS